jgi:hypothetical protein
MIKAFDFRSFGASGNTKTSSTSSVQKYACTFNHESQRLEAEYPASTSKVFNIIPSQEDWHAFLKNVFILAKVLELSGEASQASTYMVEID